MNVQRDCRLSSLYQFLFPRAWERTKRGFFFLFWNINPFLMIWNNANCSGGLWITRAIIIVIRTICDVISKHTLLCVAQSKEKEDLRFSLILISSFDTKVYARERIAFQQRNFLFQTRRVLVSAFIRDLCSTFNYVECVGRLRKHFGPVSLS